MRLLPLTLLVPSLLISLYSNANAQDATQKICHNGVCYDLGEIGDECCPFSVGQANSNAQRPENPAENFAKSKVLHSTTNKTTAPL